MAINFPTSPSLNQIYTYNSFSWIWNGSYWDIYGTSTSSSGSTGPINASGVTYDNTSSGLSATTVQNAIDEIVNTLIIQSPTNVYAKTPNRNIFIDGAYDGQNFDPSTWGSVDRLYAMPINVKQDCEFLDLFFWSLGLSGNSVFGIYENYQGLPGNLIAQTNEFDNSIVGGKTSVFQTSCQIKAGYQWVAWLTSSMPSMAYVGYQAQTQNVAPINGLTPINRVSKALLYTNTLPSTFGTPDLFQAMYPTIPLITYSITY